MLFFLFFVIFTIFVFFFLFWEQFHNISSFYFLFLGTISQYSPFSFGNNFPILILFFWNHFTIFFLFFLFWKQFHNILLFHFGNEFTIFFLFILCWQQFHNILPFHFMLATVSQYSSFFYDPYSILPVPPIPPGESFLNRELLFPFPIITS